MKRVVAIGAGRRVRGAVLPALACLADRFELAAVCARTERSLAIGGDRVIETTTIDRVDFAAADLVVVAVPPSQVPGVLALLAARARHSTLLLDTPVLPARGLQATRYFRAFRRVLVAEDTIALPPFLLARRLIEEGAIGALRRIFLFHSGYRYHALASIKRLAADARIIGVVDRRFTGKLRRKEIALEGGVSAVLYEPRDYAIGKFLVEGDRGCIADYDFPDPAVRRIGYTLEGPMYRGLTLDGEPVPPKGLDHAYLRLTHDAVCDASPMNTMKLRGLIDLLAATFEERSSFHYRPAQAISDNLFVELAERLGFVPLLGVSRRLASLAGVDY